MPFYIWGPARHRDPVSATRPKASPFLKKLGSLSAKDTLFSFSNIALRIKARYEMIWEPYGQGEKISPNIHFQKPQTKNVSCLAPPFAPPEHKGTSIKRFILKASRLVFVCFKLISFPEKGFSCSSWLFQ